MILPLLLDMDQRDYLLHRLLQPYLDLELHLVRPTFALYATDAGGYGTMRRLVHRQNLLLKQLAKLLVLVLLTLPLAVQVQRLLKGSKLQSGKFCSNNEIPEPDGDHYR